MYSSFPFGREVTIPEILNNNMIDNRVSNLAERQALTRILLTKDAELKTVSTSDDFSESELDDLGKNLDLFVIPAGGLLSAKHVDKLTWLTQLIHKLDAPCLAVGLGVDHDFVPEKIANDIEEVEELEHLEEGKLIEQIEASQAEEYPEVEEYPKVEEYPEMRVGFPEDEYTHAVKAFVDAILAHSKSVGVLGETTATYLQGLGYSSDQIDICGAPFMFNSGDKLPKLKTGILRRTSRVSYDFYPDQHEDTYTYIRNEAKKYQRSVYVTSQIYELRHLYLGKDYPEDFVQGLPADYPLHFTSPLIRNAQMVGVLDSQSWITFLGSRDFHFGSVPEATIGAIHGGTPAILITDDEGAKEIADYHNLPYVSRPELEESKALTDTNDPIDILNLYVDADFERIYEGHQERFGHFLEFLDYNQVRHNMRSEITRMKTPYDEMLGDFKGYGTVFPLTKISLMEQETRLNEYINYSDQRYQKKAAEAEEQSMRLERQIAMLNASIDKLKANLAERDQELAKAKGDNENKSKQIEDMKEELEEIKSKRLYKIFH